MGTTHSAKTGLEWTARAVRDGQKFSPGWQEVLIRPLLSWVTRVLDVVNHAWTVPNSLEDFSLTGGQVKVVDVSGGRCLRIGDRRCQAHADAQDEEEQALKLHCVDL